MSKFKLGLIIFAVVVLIAQLFVIDYNDLSLANNTGTYMGIISMICVIIATILFFLNEKKNKA